MSDPDKIFKNIQGLIADTLNIDSALVTPESKLLDLSADSIQLFELLVAFENSYKFEVSYDDVIKLSTVQDVVSFICQQQQKS